jgi:hypothetical protein
VLQFANQHLASSFKVRDVTLDGLQLVAVLDRRSRPIQAFVVVTWSTM